MSSKPGKKAPKIAPGAQDAGKASKDRQRPAKLSPKAQEAAEDARKAKLPAGPDSPSAIRSLMNEVNKGGRPTECTPELIEKIVTYVMDGNYVETACLLAGIAKKTFYNWLKMGQEETGGIHAKFLHAIEKAAAWSEARDLNAIGAAGRSNWQARAWRLERRFPERYGRFVKFQGAIATADVGESLSPEDEARIAGELGFIFGGPKPE